jgi:hypothetical protein
MPAHRKLARSCARYLWPRLVLPGLLGIAVLVPRAAAAQSQRQAELVTAAERAARLGEYEFAIAAFEQAFLADSKPSLLLATADACRGRYVVAGSQRDRRKAIRSYRAYLAAGAQGSGAERARKALAELEGPADHASPDPSGEPAEQAPVTWLAVLSPLMGAEARLDGKKARKLPLFAAIEPGIHAIDVSAPGYRKQTHKVRALRGLVQAVTVELEPEPAKLTVAGTGGAEVLIDGRFVGLAPIEEPIDVPPGALHVAVLLNGYLPYTATVDLRPGATKELEVELAMTRRRIGATVLLALGGASVLTGVGFGAASIATDTSIAQEEDSPDGERVLGRGGDYRVVSGMAAGVGLGLSLAGALLFTFDEPERPVEVEPKVGPGLAGVALRGRF